MNKSIRYTMVLMLAAVLSSCHIYRKYELPENSSAQIEAYRNAIEAPVDSTSLEYISWEQVFTDPLLQGYIRRALEHNHDLKDAYNNVKIAQAQLKGAKLSYFPSLALNPNGGAASYDGSKMNNWSYTIPLAANWEIDVFGKILNRKRGAQVSVEQMQDYEQAVRSQIICGVANTYYTLVLLKQQLDLTERTSVIWKDQVESMKAMKEAAYVNEAAVVQSAANYWSIMGSIPDIKQSITTASNTLSTLLGEYPSEWEVTSDLTFSLPAEISKGVPMAYLAVRPDVRAAERGLAAAYYTTNSARAAFYPTLSISAQGGFTNLLGSMITNPGVWFAQLAGQLAAPLFSRGQNIATLEVAKARQEQAMSAFEKTVLSASADVSNALAQIKNISDKKIAVDNQIDNLEKSVEYTQELLV
ncbi:MAG: TolC family protein, partial [Muribaculaceae bacterium]|nr:TolC family protein [Muribaculaceae bacterium]